MTTRDLIQNIVSEIGFVNDGQSVDSYLAARCLNLLNRCVYRYNLQGFLSFSQSISQLPLTNSQCIFTDDIPISISYVYYSVSNSYNYKLREVPYPQMPSFHNTTSIPSYYSYTKQLQNDTIVGIFQINSSSSSYPLFTVLNRKCPTLTLDSEFLYPDEYQELFMLDVQLQLLKNEDVASSLITNKSNDLKSITNWIKSNNFKNIPSMDYANSLDAAFYSGAGRLSF